MTRDGYEKCEIVTHDTSIINEEPPTANCHIYPCKASPNRSQWLHCPRCVSVATYLLGIFKYNQRDATLHNLFISVKCSTCFRGFLRPSSGVQKLYIHHRVLCQTFTATCHCCGRDGTTVAFNSKGLTKYPMLCIQIWAPDDGRRNRLKHVEHFTEVNKLCNVASRWLYLKIHLRCTDPWTSNLLAGIVGSNPAGGMDVCLLSVLCFLRHRSLC